MTVIAADFVPIEPYTTTNISVGIGQRYDVIIEANPTAPSTNGKYWMRTEYSRGPGGSCNSEVVGAPSSDKDSQRTGIISYLDAPDAGEPTTVGHGVQAGCLDESPRMKPIVPWKVTSPQNDPTKNTYEAGVDDTNKDFWHHAFRRWSLTDTPMWLDMSNPTIMNLDNKTWNPEYGVVNCT